MLTAIPVQTELWYNVLLVLLPVGISVVSMQRLPVNGLNLELLQALGKTFDDLEKNKSRGMILTSVS